MLTRLIIHIAYSLQLSLTYLRGKQFFHNLLENPNSVIKSYFDVFMICLVMFNVFLLIREVNTPLTEAEMIFEDVLVSIFITEYLLRVWLYRDTHKIILEAYEKATYLGIPFNLAHATKVIISTKLEYMLSPLALIDLLAILPGYRPLRMYRMLQMFRLFKLFRYFNSIKLFSEILASKRFDLYTLATFLGILVFIGSTAIYMFEFPAQNGHIKNLFDAFYFSLVTVATVGYGDISPQTNGGRIVTMALIMSGLGVLSFFVSIIVSAFNDKMTVLRENRVYTEISRFNNFVIICGFGRVGQHIAAQLQKDQLQFVIIDTDPIAIQLAKQSGHLAIQADASKNQVLCNAGINAGATAVLCTTGNDVINVYVTLTSRHLNPEIRIISRVNREENAKKLYQAGANNVIQPFEIAGMVVAEYVGQPVAFEAILGIIREEQQCVMETLCVQAGCMIDGQVLGSIDFDQRKLLLIGVISENSLHNRHQNRYTIKNQHFYFNPPDHFALQHGDLLMVMGRDYSIEHFRGLIEKSRLTLRRKR